MEKKYLVDWITKELEESIEIEANTVDRVCDDLEKMSEFTLLVLKKRINFFLRECLNFENEVLEIENKVLRLKIQNKRLKENKSDD